MGVKTDLTDALHSAMKEKNDTSKNAIRLALSSIKLAEIEKGEDLEDVEIFGILHKEIKTKEEKVTEAVKDGRKGMIITLENEIKVIKGFLPSELTDDELTAEIKKVISNLNATTIKQMGIVMKVVIENVQGHASNDRISKITKSLLQPK